MKLALDQRSAVAAVLSTALAMSACSSGSTGGGQGADGGAGSTGVACDLTGSQGWGGACKITLTEATKDLELLQNPDNIRQCGTVMKCLAAGSSDPSLCIVSCKSDADCSAVGAGTCPAAACTSCNRACTGAPTLCR